jgi:methyl-accepting chemotaxis protein
MICKETRKNIEKVRECFDNIIAFMENDIKTQFKDFVAATDEYDTSITQIQEIINDVSGCSDVFSQVVSDIRIQIDNVHSNPSEVSVSTGEMLAKVEETKQTSANLVDIVKVNEKNAVSIKKIVNRFSD